MSLSSCNQNRQTNVEVVWEDKRAVGLSIPKGLFANDTDSIEQRLKVYVGKNKATAILGEYKVEDDRVVVKPLIPLSRGLSYHVYYDDKLVAEVDVPVADKSEAQRLVAVYPTSDTIPENLLKIYLQFSGAMREGDALKHIALLDHNNDTVQGVFLDLQPELWNKERTVLTVWLDPGRIKRDLIPNQQLGSPLKKGEHYTLAIANTWTDVQGLPLQQAYKKSFVVTERDGTSPALGRWQINLSKAQTKQPLEINFNEPLDYFLLLENIRVVDENDNKIEGKIVVSNKESKLQFTPAINWAAGNYRVQVDPVLEDLAGNNLNRPFDRDLQVKNATAAKAKFEISFQVK